MQSTTPCHPIVRGVCHKSTKAARYVPLCIEHVALLYFLLSIEIDAVGYSGEHIAVDYAVMLSHTHNDAVAVWIDHGLVVLTVINQCIINQLLLSSKGQDEIM